MRLPETIVIPFLLPTIGAAQGVEQIFSTKDAVIGYHYGINSANTNYNSADWYGAMSQPGNHGGPNHARSLIHFDLSDYPPGTPIDDASLDLFGRGAVTGGGAAASVGNIGDNECVIERITALWFDNTVTWNTTPSTTSQDAVSLPVSSATIQDYIGINVTEMVQTMIDNPGTSHGFCIRLVDETPTRGLFFCGNGYIDQTKRPRLNVKVNTISVQESSAIPVARMYPNPAQAGGTLVLQATEEIGPGKVQFIGPDGRLAAVLPAGSDTTIRLPQDLSAGTYMVLWGERDGRDMRPLGLVLVEGAQ